MELNEYITTQMNGKIERRGNSPLAPIIITILGAALLLAAYTLHTSDTLQTTLLTLGFISAAVGVVWAVLCVTKTLWHYYYLPTASPMHDKTLYLSTEDFQFCTEALEKGDIKLLKTLSPVVSSNAVLRIVYSCDHSIALLQTGRMDTSRLETSSPVVTLMGEDLSAILSLIH
ncbi:MAG: hypothetical protein IJM33_04930 [Bacteroidales bacterium]|nr:hypothetical protein [Bacteroidales bacterium]